MASNLLVGSGGWGAGDGGHGVECMGMGAGDFRHPSWKWWFQGVGDARCAEGGRFLLGVC